MANITSERYKILDFVKYDLEDTDQKDAYDIAVVKLQDMVCTSHNESGGREYKAYNISAPDFPTRGSFGYENLKDGSIIMDLASSSIYMFSSIPNDGVGEWIML